MTSIRTSLFSLFIALVVISPLARAETEAAKSATVFDEVWKIVRDRFYDRELRRLDWNAIGDRYRPLVASAPSDRERAAVINRMAQTSADRPASDGHNTRSAMDKTLASAVKHPGLNALDEVEVSRMAAESPSVAAHQDVKS